MRQGRRRIRVKPAIPDERVGMVEVFIRSARSGRQRQGRAALSKSKVCAVMTTDTTAGLGNVHNSFAEEELFEWY